MAYLRFYDVEKQLFKKEHMTTINKKDIDAISKKLAHHFKFNYKGHKLRKMRKTLGMANYNYTITYRKGLNVNLLLLIHELSHLWQLKKYGDWKNYHCHNKEMLKFMAKMIKYCWKNESIVYILRSH
jgi:hypothetical protein